MDLYSGTEIANLDIRNNNVFYLRWKNPIVSGGRDSCSDSSVLVAGIVIVIRWTIRRLAPLDRHPSDCEAVNIRSDSYSVLDARHGWDFVAPGAEMKHRLPLAGTADREILHRLALRAFNHEPSRQTVVSPCLKRNWLCVPTADRSVDQSLEVVMIVLKHILPLIHVKRHTVRCCSRYSRDDEIDLPVLPPNEERSIQQFPVKAG